MADDRRVALVTGANRGLGLEIARQLAGRGLVVVIAARDADRGRRVVASLTAAGHSASCVQIDVTDDASVERAVKDTARTYGTVDVLVNNAGIAVDEQQRAEDPDFELVEQTLQTNLIGAWRCCVAVIPYMRRRGYGRIVNMSSRLAALSTMGVGEPAYRVSKTGLNALTRVLADELRDTGILVNAASPGWVRTEMGGPGAPLTVEEGAWTPVWLATLPDDGPTGGFFFGDQQIDW